MTITMSKLSLLPLALFLLSYVGASALLGDFDSVPMTVAFVGSSALAVAVSRGSLAKRLRRFSEGAGDRNILLMVWIYVLAGAFSASTVAIGAVDSTVNLMLHLLPGSMVFTALFVTAAFVSLAIGTSVGTIVALVPIAAGLAGQLGQTPALLAALVVGGAYFGDNLSFISDTTIAATQTQGVKMTDKFRQNIRLVWPAVLAMLVYCVWAGLGVTATQELSHVSFVRVVPYAAVLAFSLIGFHVVVSLGIGIALSTLIAVLSLGPRLALSALGQGIGGMGDLIVIALLAGGMLELIRANGGLRLIVGWLQRLVRGRRGGEVAIAALVGTANLCTANNTVAIITVGRIVRDLSQRFGVDPRRAAAVLDTASCVVQGLLPYGVQMLLAARLAGCTPLDILPKLYYPMLLAPCILVYVLRQGRGDRG